MAKDDWKTYDGQTATWVKATPEEAAHYQAIEDGKPLPSDRTAAELASLEPGFAGPVATAGVVRAPLPQPPAAPSDKKVG